MSTLWFSQTPIRLINYELSLFLRFPCGPVFAALVASLVASFRGRTAFKLQILALRDELRVLHRSASRPKLVNVDRILWAWLCEIWTGCGIVP